MATVMAEIEAVITADSSQFDSAMSKSGAAVDDLGAKGKTASANFGAASAAMAAGAVGIGVGIADAVMAAGDFQSAMNEIGAVTGATAEQMAQLSATALQVGMDTSFSAQQGAEAISELGKAGIPIADIINGAAMATANLAAAGGVDMPRAAEVMSNAMNSFGLSGSQAADVADTLAAASNASASDVNSLAMGLAQVAPSARGLGLSLEETVAQLALFSNYGMQGSDAGTSFKTMIASLTPATKKAHEAFQDLGLETADVANKFFDAQGHFVGMEQATNLLYEALAPLTDQQRLEAEETIFGSDASRAAEITFQAQKAAVEGTAEGYGSLLDAVEPAGQATDVANAKMAGMNGALEALRGSVETAQIAFGTAFLPVVEQVADKLTDLVNGFLSLDPQMQTTISAVAAGAAGFLAVGSAIGFIIGPLGAMVTALAPVAVGVAAIAAPLALVVAGIAALKIAYDTNFLGFADGVNALIPVILEGFGNLVTLAQNVAAAFGTAGLGGALGVLGSAFVTAWDTIQTAITSIDWDAVSTGIQTALQGMSDTILTWAGEQGTAIADGFKNINWTDVGSALLTGITTAVGLVVGLDVLLVSKGADLLAGLLKGMTDKWPAVDTWLKGVAQDAIDTVGDLAPTLLPRGTDLMAGLFKGITDTWPEIDAWLLGLGQDAADTVGDLAATLVDHGTELLDGLRNGAQDFWDTTVVPWLQSLPTLAATAVGDLSETLIDHGAELLDGMRHGIVDLWNNTLRPWLQALPGEITAAIGDLYQTGLDIVGNFLRGLQDAWTGVTDWATNISIPWPDLSIGLNIPNPIDEITGGDPAGDARKARAGGGPVSSGQAYWVGEREPELFVPSRSGTIVPGHDVAGASGTSGGGSTFIIETLTAVLPGVTNGEQFIESLQQLMYSGDTAMGRVVG